MCGICGIVDCESTFEDRALETVQHMAARLAHRGPDDAGIVRTTGAILGHRRLAVQDLSSTGHQPMVDDEGRYVLVYNGELYNGVVLRDRLSKAGSSFRGSSDTEVVLEAFRHWGRKCLDEFCGMFALAVYDRFEKRLFLARDRIGIKPLYYGLVGGRFYFASELQALLVVDELRGAIDRQALARFLVWRFNGHAQTVVSGLQRVLPGQWIEFDGQTVQRRQWWRMVASQPSVSRSEGEWLDELDGLYRRVVSDHLVSDVPVGIFLSSGIDSNMVTARVVADGSIPVQTFSVGFPGSADIDELAAIAVSARHFKSDHHELTVSGELSELLPRVVAACDVPMADPAAVATFLLCQRAAQTVKVVLSGEGGDELFAGYERTSLLYYAHRYLRWLPQRLRRTLVSICSTLPHACIRPFFRYVQRAGSGGFERLLSLLVNVEEPLRALEASNGVFLPSSLAALLVDGLPEDWSEQSFAGATTEAMVAEQLRYEIETRLPANLLMKLDGTTMAASIEGRVPLLDHRLVEFAARVPVDLKIRWATNKYLWRKLARRHLPLSIRQRRKEHFYVPVEDWLRHELRPMVEEYLSPRRLTDQGLFRPTIASELYSRFDESPLIYGRQLWSLLWFQLWHDRHYEGRETTHIASPCPVVTL